jgi:hypothetical protein
VARAKAARLHPDLTEASALMWIDRYLEKENAPEALRKKALAGALTDREFRALRDRRRVRPRWCPRLNRGKPHSHAGFRVQAPGLWAPRAEGDRAGAP